MRPAISLACTVTCSKCKQTVTGRLDLDIRYTVCDSVGFILAGTNKPHVVCDPCARERGMPMCDEVVTEADISDEVKKRRLVDRLARGLYDD